MSAWKAGKVLWFDDLAGEGVIVDKQGNSYYVNQGSLSRKSRNPKNKKEVVLKDNAKVEFTTYQNAYLVQVDKVKKATV